MSCRVLKREACLHAFMCMYLFTLLLLDHKVVDLFVYPIYAQCQMMGMRTGQIPRMFCPSMTLDFTSTFHEPGFGLSQNKLCITMYIVLEMFVLHALISSNGICIHALKGIIQSHFLLLVQ